MYSMRCLRCGAGVDPLDERCARCGELTAAVVSAPPLVPSADGIPVVRFTPGVDGALVAPEPYLTGELMAESVVGPRRRQRLHIVLPRTSQNRRGQTHAGVVLLLVVLIAAAVAGGVLVRGSMLDDWLGALGPPTPAPRATALPPTATPRPTCAAQPVDQGAARVITHAQMTTGLRDPGAQDYRPIDNASTFRVGQRAYITFMIATTHPGTAEVRFCTPAGTVPGMLAVPAGVSGRYGQFSVDLSPDEAGHAVATLLWNGTVAASIPFTVTAT
jgi:hypothetical protein